MESGRRMAAGARAGLAAALAAAAIGCGDGGGPAGPTLELDSVQGLYDVVAITFDPQGSAPEADVLQALAAGGIAPELNIARTGTFQLFYRDPATGEIVPVNGQVEPFEDGIELVFPSRAAADQFVFPLRLPLTFNEAEGTLTFSGSAAVSRGRLQQLFPELYGDEPWTSETIPGELDVLFRR